MVKINARSSAWSIAKRAVVVVVAPLLVAVAALSSPAFADVTGTTGISSPVAGVAAGATVYSVAEAVIDDPNGHLVVWVYPNSSDGHRVVFDRYGVSGSWSTRCYTDVAVATGQFTVSPDLSAGSLTVPTGLTADCGYGGVTYPLPDHVVWTSDPNALNSYGEASGPQARTWGCWGAQVDDWRYVQRNGTATASSNGGPGTVGSGGLGYEYSSSGSTALPPARQYC